MGKCNCEIFHWDNCAVNNICKICNSDYCIAEQMEIFFMADYTIVLLVHGQVTIIFEVSVCLFVCLCRVFLSRL